MPALSDLAVTLSANTAALRSGLDAAAEHLKTFGERVKSIDEKIKAFSEMKGIEIGKELVAGLAEFVQKGAEAAASAGRLAQAAGVPVETFSRLSYAAQLSHIAAEDFAKSLEKLDRNLGEAGAGAAKQSALFQALGIAVKDSSGHVRSTDSVLGDLAQRFAGMEDGASKTALAMEVFGKSGAQLIPFLNEGRDGLAELEAESDRLGITISGRTAKAAEQFEQNLTKLKLAAQGVAAHAAGALAPALTNLTNKLLGSKEGADALKSAGEFLANTLKVLVSAGIIVGAIFDAVGHVLARVASAVVNVVQGNFREAYTDLKGMSSDTEAAISTAHEQIKTVWTTTADVVDSTEKKKTSAVKGASDSILANFQRLEKAPELFKKGMEGLQKVLDHFGKQSAELAGGGKDPLAEIQYRLDKGDLARDLALVGDQAVEMRKKILDAAAALEKLKIGNLKIKLDFETGLADQKTDFDASKRTQNFNNIGASQGSVWSQLTAGFTDFNDAMTQNTNALKDQAEYTERARIDEAKGNTEKMQEDLALAQAAGFAADKANAAAGAFEQMKAAGSQFVNGLKVLGQSFTSKLGQLGQTINDAIQGFQSGGIWGALAALVMDLLSMMDGWKSIQNIAQGQLMTALKDMSSGLGGIISGLKPLMGAIGMIASAIHGVLNPILEVIGDILKGLAPIFAVIGLVLKPLGGIFKSIGSVLSTVLKPALDVISYIFIGLGEVLLALEVACDSFWLAMVTAADEILKAFGNHSLENARAQANQALQDTEQQMVDLSKQTPQSLTDLANASADAAETLGASANKTSTALSKFSQSLQNAPSGFKLAALTFQSMQATGTMGALATAGGSGGMYIDKLEVRAASLTDLYAALLKVHKKKKFHDGGG